MKKLLLTLFVGLVGFISFSNADFTVTQNGDSYSPNTLTIEENTTIQSSDIQSTCNYEGKCNMVLWKGDKVYTIEHFIAMGFWQFYTDESEENGGSSEFYLYLTPGTYTLTFDGGGEDEDNGAFTSITFTNIGNTTQGGVGGDSGNSDSGNSNSGILSGGISNLTPIITTLKSVVNEFIPYVIYLGIGLLIAVLGFKAIKWLVNWLGIRVHSVFSSGKRRR